MSTYQEVRFWSPTLGCDAARVSMVDDRGGEHYCIVPRVTGKEWRDLRASALEQVMEHIAWGNEPGLVDVDLLRQAGHA